VIVSSDPIRGVLLTNPPLLRKINEPLCISTVASWISRSVTAEADVPLILVMPEAIVTIATVLNTARDFRPSITRYKE